ncbi:unnamed protein product [Victoria cruziana]
MKSFIEKIYMGILICITNIYKINVQFFLDSAKKTLNGYTYNDEIKEKDTNETNPNIIPFISTVRSLSTYTTNISSDSNSLIYYDLSSLSQAYVFYKLFQTQVSNKYKPESLFNYYRTEWKNWLKSHYQYNLSHDKWSRLAPLKWRKKVNQHRMIKNNDSPKLGSYEEKDQLIHSGKKDYDKLGLLKSLSRKKKLKNTIDMIFYLINILIMKMDQNLDRKYFELRITNFYPRNNMETRTSMGITTFINKKRKLLRLGPIRKIFFLFISEFIKKSKQSKKSSFLIGWE